MPAPADSAEVDLLLERLKEGEVGARDELFERAYAKLHGLARSIAPGQTLGPTVLVNEAYLRLSRQTGSPSDRTHFYRLVARAMRHTVVDYYRLKARRPGALEETIEVPEPRLERGGSHLDALALDDALRQLEGLSADQAELAELRLFGGYSTAEAAELMGVSKSTAERLWRAARAFLKLRLS
jgi:RNA polymerase sigma factor (TIGR02999 family)